MKKGGRLSITSVRRDHNPSQVLSRLEVARLVSPIYRLILDDRPGFGPDR